MMKTVARCAALLLMAVTCLWAQGNKEGNLGRVYLMVPKPGMTKQFEDGRKKHMAWHKSQNDAWRWDTYEIETGNDAGAYLSVTFGHDWPDFDAWESKYGAADTADGEVNMNPYVAGGTNGIWMYMSKISKPPSSMEPSKLAEVVHFMVKSSGDRQFEDGIAKISEAIKKTNWPSNYFWYTLVNGGKGPHYVLVIPHNSYADMAEPNPSFEKMLENAMGEHEAEALMDTVNGAIDEQRSEIIHYRPDLSYVPAGMGH